MKENHLLLIIIVITSLSGSKLCAMEKGIAAFLIGNPEATREWFSMMEQVSPLEVKVTFPFGLSTSSSSDVEFHSFEFNIRNPTVKDLKDAVVDEFGALKLLDIVWSVKDKGEIGHDDTEPLNLSKLIHVVYRK